MEVTIQKTIIPKDDDNYKGLLPTIEVTFEAQVDMVDNSFTHAFGIEKRIDPELRSVKYDRHKYTELENQLIYEWTLENQDELAAELEEKAQEEHDNF